MLGCKGLIDHHLEQDLVFGFCLTAPFPGTSASLTPSAAAHGKSFLKPLHHSFLLAKAMAALRKKKSFLFNLWKEASHTVPSTDLG